MSRNLLKSFKIKDKSKLTAKQTIIYLGVYFIFGILLGVIAKYSDTVPSNSESGMFYSIISDITTSIGIWIALATLISVWSRSAIYAALKVLAFFVGMLLGYYIYSQVLFGFFPSYYFLRWGAIALVSPICAYIVWFSRGEGWGPAFCAALTDWFVAHTRIFILLCVFNGVRIRFIRCTIAPCYTDKIKSTVSKGYSNGDTYCYHT